MSEMLGDCCPTRGARGFGSGTLHRGFSESGEPLPENAFDVAITPDGAFAYLTEIHGFRVKLIETATYAQVDRVFGWTRFKD